MNASEFIEYCKSKYVGKVVALKCPMYLYDKDGSAIGCPRGHTNIIKDVCTTDSGSVKFCFKEHGAIFNIYRFREVNPYDGCRVVSDLFEIVNN